MIRATQRHIAFIRFDRTIDSIDVTFLIHVRFQIVPEYVEYEYTSTVRLELSVTVSRTHSCQLSIKVIPGQLRARA